MLTVLLVVILILALGGGGWAWNAGGPIWGGGIGIGGLLLIVLIIYLLRPF